MAGTGAYFLGRVLRLGIVAAAFAGTVFELSGTFFVWLGWPIASVLSWTGWLLAAIVVILSGRHRVGAVCLFSVVTGVLGVRRATGCTGLARSDGRGLHHRPLGACGPDPPDRSGRCGRPVVDLSHWRLRPGCSWRLRYWLPGIQLISGSIRSTGEKGYNGKNAMPGVEFLRAAFSEAIGTPAFHGYDYIGIVAVALLACALRFRIRRPTTMALVVVTAVAAAIAFLRARDFFGAMRFPDSAQSAFRE